MSTFNRPTVRHPVETTTYEGGAAWEPGLGLQLKLLASTLYADEDTFYESKADRMSRYVALVHQIATKPTQFRHFLRDLVRDAKIRNAAIVAAAEFAWAAGRDQPGLARWAVNEACVRADAPTELLAYWLETYGKPISQCIDKGLSDAVSRLYTEQAVVKYDSERRKVRMGDLVQLCRPKPSDETQAALFKYLVARRKLGFDARVNAQLLPRIAAYHELWRMPEAIRTSVPDGMIERAGMTWEQYTAWLPGVMDAAKWEEIIPRMQYMALIRNLRNFDQAGISAEAAEFVVGKLLDPALIVGSKVFPYHLMSAWANTDNLQYQRALGYAMDVATRNVTPMDNSLILIDVSASMNASLSRRSKVTRAQVAMLQGVSLAVASKACDMVLFATSNRAVSPRGSSIMDRVRDLTSIGLGGGTNGHTAIAQHYNADHHERVVIFTDDQMRDAGIVDVSHVPWIITFTCAGYRPVTGYGRGRISIGGFTNEVFEAAARLTGQIF